MPSSTNEEFGAWKCNEKNRKTTDRERNFATEIENDDHNLTNSSYKVYRYMYIKSIMFVKMLNLYLYCLYLIQTINISEFYTKEINTMLGERLKTRLLY